MTLYTMTDTPPAFSLSARASRVLHLLIIAVSLALGAFILFQSGYGNSYYAAAVKSMMQSWHNFFFVSYDPGGFITVDKPPLALWLQTISALIFGYHGWALLLPSLVATVVSVELLYRIVRRNAGEGAGLLAAGILALSPVSVLLSATNETDPVLIACMLASAWAVFRAIDTKRIRYLVLSAFMLGLAFNTKMLQAFLILPALVVVYYVAVDLSWKIKIRNLIVAAVVLSAVSFSWIGTVDSISASARPYVGSTTNDSEISLALGYNGTQRLFGQTSGFMLGLGSGDTRSGQATRGASRGSETMQGQGLMGGGRGFGPGGEGMNNGGGFGGGPGGGGGGMGGGNSAFGGQTGVFRLWGEALGGQVGWFVALAIAGLLAVVVRERPRRLPLSSVQSAGVFWGLYFIAGAVVFSIAQFMHPYYTATLVPAVAALAAIGFMQMYGWFARRDTYMRYVLPCALVLAAAGQYAILSYYSSYAWLSWSVAGLTALAAIVLFYSASVRAPKRLFVRAAIALALLALSLAPVTWDAYTIRHAQSINETIPTAGPSTSGSGGGRGMPGGMGMGEGGRKNGRGMPPGMTGSNESRGPGGIENTSGMGGSIFGSSSVDSTLLSYLLEHQGSAKYIVATESSHSADGLIINSGKPVIAWGGFSGTDPAITLTAFKQLIADGELKYVYLSEQGGGMGGGSDTSTTSIASWAKSSCTAVSSISDLYDCSNAVE